MERVRVDGAMVSADGRWRVEAVRRGQSRWYRILHGEDVIDWLAIGQVKEILDEAGVDLAGLTEVDPAA